MPCTVARRPAEAVGFKDAAGLLVGLLVEDDLEPVGLQVADDLAAVELLVFCGLGLLLLPLVQLGQTVGDALDVAPTALQLVSRERAAIKRKGCSVAFGEYAGAGKPRFFLRGDAGAAIQRFVLAIEGVGGLCIIQ